MRLDSYEQLIKGGESGAAIVWGNHAASELYKLITLDPHDKRAMPPKGKTPLSTQEIKLIKAWIAQSGQNTMKVSQINNISEYADLLLPYITDMKASTSKADSLPTLAPIDPMLLTKLRAMGFQVNLLMEG